jgi:hypothetical protein
MNELGRLKAEIERLTERQSILREGKTLASAAINHIAKHFAKENENKTSKIATLKHKNAVAVSKDEHTTTDRSTVTRRDENRRRRDGDEVGGAETSGISKKTNNQLKR